MDGVVTQQEISVSDNIEILTNTQDERLQEMEEDGC